MNNQEILRDFYGKIIGYIETDNIGNKVIRDKYRKILGRYDKKSNVTRDFYGRIVGRGDQSSILFLKDKLNKK